MLFRGHLKPGWATGIFRRSIGFQRIQIIRRLAILRFWKDTTIQMETAARTGLVSTLTGATSGRSQTALQQIKIRVTAAARLLLSTNPDLPLIDSTGDYWLHDGNPKALFVLREAAPNRAHCCGRILRPHFTVRGK